MKGLQVGDGLVTAPTLGDVDGDGRPEVVTLTMRGDVFVRKADGKALPGWPARFQGHHEQASPLVADLDGTGGGEVVLAVNKQVHVLDKAGRPLAGWPKPTRHLVLCSPAAGDVDGDGGLEVVVLDEEANLYVFDAAGRALPGWPRKVGAYSNTTPALVDLDGEPGMEIVTGTTDGWLVALRADGTAVPGAWPVQVGMMGPASPAAGDLDGDGEAEIVAVNAAGVLYLLDRQGFQGKVGRVAGQYSFSSPALRDLDGDGRAEIAVGAGQPDGSGFLSLFDAEGTMMPGWPVATGADVSASPALVDLDGDGRREVLVPDLSGQLHALRVDGRPLPGWPRRPRRLGALLPGRRGPGRGRRAGGRPGEGRARCRAHADRHDLRHRDGSGGRGLADLQGRSPAERRAAGASATLILSRWPSTCCPTWESSVPASATRCGPSAHRNPAPGRPWWTTHGWALSG